MAPFAIGFFRLELNFRGSAYQYLGLLLVRLDHSAFPTGIYPSKDCGALDLDFVFMWYQYFLHEYVVHFFNLTAKHVRTFIQGALPTASPP